MTHRMELHAAVLLEWLENNPGNLMPYPDLADELGWSVTTTQNVYRYLGQIYTGGNLVVPSPYNGYVAGLQLEPDAETFDGIANQERHLRTRHVTQRHRVDVARTTASDRSDKRVLKAYGDAMGAMEAARLSIAEMLQAAADRRKPGAT
jgi:hypothetical protein